MSMKNGGNVVKGKEIMYIKIVRHPNGESYENYVKNQMKNGDKASIRPPISRFPRGK